MAELSENYRAGEKLVVGSLEVLQDFKSAGMRRIESKIEMLDKNQITLKSEQIDYWSALADDNLLTPVEKKELAKYLKEEETLYNRIIADARKANCENASEIQAYKSYYAFLLNYIYNILGVFLHPDENTSVIKDQFNKVFADFQEKKKAAQDYITQVNYTDTAHKVSVQEIDEDNIGEYLGAKIEFPIYKTAGAIHTNSWFTWGAADYKLSNQGIGGQRVSGNELKKGHVYKCEKRADCLLWTEVEDNAHNAKELTTALGDILAVSNTIDYGYFRHLIAESIMTRAIKMPKDSYIYAGDFDTKQHILNDKGEVTDEKLITEHTDKGKVLEYVIAKGGIPKYALKIENGKEVVDTTRENKGFILSGNGDAAFSGTFRGDFHNDLFDVEKKTLNDKKSVSATAGEDIFAVIQRIAETYGTKEAPIKKANLTFESPQTFNGEQITSFAWNIIEENQTGHGTGRIYYSWDEEHYEGVV